MSENNFNAERNKRKFSRQYRLAQKLYSLSNYASYHAYRRSASRLSFYLAFLVIMGALSCFWNNTVSKLMSSAVLAGLLMYLFVYSWLMFKSRQLRLDSQKVMQGLEFNSGQAISSWRVYDGSFTGKGVRSLEISFVRDASFLSNAFWLVIGKGKILPPSKPELECLKKILLILARDRGSKWVVYGTLTADLKESLLKNGISLEPLPRKFLTKPGRWNYAAARGSLADGFWRFPHTFKPYLLRAAKN